MAKSNCPIKDYLRDPAAGIARVMASGPVVAFAAPMVGNVWITTTQELAGRVLKDSETFTQRDDAGGIAGFRWWIPGALRALADNMLTIDEPDHTRLREIVNKAFHRRAILDMEPRIRAIADELASELFADGSPVDLVDRYARKLALSVIWELLGLPLADRPRFITWANAVAGATGPVGLVRMIGGLAALKFYLAGRLKAARKHGGEGLIAELVRVEKESGRISAGEMVAMVFLMIDAGSESTTHLITGSVYELAKNPTLRDWLKEDWSRVDMAVEEFLRFTSPVQFSKARFVRRDVELGGVRLKKGERIMAMVAAANMDPDANVQPDRLDLERRPNRHLAFGTGIHYCVGHHLARIEAKCAIQALFERWPKLELAAGPGQIRWQKRPGLRDRKASRGGTPSITAWTHGHSPD